MVKKNSWLEITLDEGRNRHIRRLLAAHGIDTLRLLRVAMGSLQLGELGKGQWRHLTAQEVEKNFCNGVSTGAKKPGVKPVRVARVTRVRLTTLRCLMARAFRAPV